MKCFTVIFTIIALFCLVSGQEVPKSVDEAISKISEAIGQGINIPNLDDLKNINLTDLHLGEIEDLVKTKCDKNGGTEAYEKAKQGVTDLFHCTSNLVNVTLLTEEIKEAKPTGNLDEVFQRYCRKKPTLKNCLFNFADAVKPCLETEEVKNQKIVKNVVEKVLNFTCFKEGDRIALFVAAKGPECIQEKSQSIFNKCGKIIDDSIDISKPFNISRLNEIKSLPLLVFDDKFCRKLDKFQQCTVAELETCEDPTPANLLDSIFNYIKKVTPCEKMLGDQPLPPQAQTMVAGSPAANTAGAVLTFVSILVLLS